VPFLSMPSLVGSVVGNCIPELRYVWRARAIHLASRDRRCLNLVMSPSAMTARGLPTEHDRKISIRYVAGHQHCSTASTGPGPLLQAQPLFLPSCSANGSNRPICQLLNGARVNARVSYLPAVSRHASAAS